MYPRWFRSIKKSMEAFIFNDRKVLRKKYKADPKQYKHEKKVSKAKIWC